MTITITWAAGAVIIAILGHAFFTVWHASRLNTSVANCVLALTGINTELKERDTKMVAMWNKIDIHSEKIIKIEARMEK